VIEPLIVCVLQQYASAYLDFCVTIQRWHTALLTKADQVPRFIFVMQR
jgi:hypothetical protein